MTGALLDPVSAPAARTALRLMKCAMLGLVGLFTFSLVRAGYWPVAAALLLALGPLSALLLSSSVARIERIDDSGLVLRPLTRTVHLRYDRMASAMKSNNNRHGWTHALYVSMTRGWGPFRKRIVLVEQRPHHVVRALEAHDAPVWNRGAEP